ncbi:hypothetical protein MD484_g5326, partial [Candolleomyces efflorescens]
MGHHSFKVIHKGAANRRRGLAAPLEARASDACYTGSFYTAPKLGDTVDAMDPLKVTWDSSCLADSSLVDVWLYIPGRAVHRYAGISNKKQEYNAKIMPRWWNNTSPMNLQLLILPADAAPFTSDFAPGPIFKATYTKPEDGSTPVEADTNQLDIGVTYVKDDSKGMTPGKTAAAVLIPLIFIGLCIGAYLKWKRGRGLEQRKKWTEQVDKRMSTISTDWKSVSAKGAQAAIRNSMAVGARASSFSFGAGIRPSGEYTNEKMDDPENMAQRRPGIGLRNPSALASSEALANRVSRVSFANDPRPSVESRRTKAFRDSYVPPVPALPAKDDGEESSNEGSGTMSPTQTVGAMSLTPEDIRARIQAGRARSASNAVQQQQQQQYQYAQGERDVTDGGMDGYDDSVMPALALMRTGHTGPNNSTSGDDLLFSAPTAPAATYPGSTSPAPSYTTTAQYAQYPTAQYATATTPVSPTNTGMSSPVMGTIPMAGLAMPASVMSPDDMLRAYAERKKSMSAAPSSPIVGTSSIAYPMPVANSSTSTSNSAGRTLFNGSVVSPQSTGELQQQGGGGQKRQPSLGFAPGEYDPNFKWDVKDAYGEDDVDAAGSGNVAGRGAWRG